MDTFIKLPPNERQAYFQETAARLGVSAAIIEKDFWVCWTLQELFTLPDAGPHLIFKGGTSLSKVYRIIDRFSEDINISIARDYLGFGGNQDPESATGGKERDRRMKSLMDAAKTKIADELRPALIAAFKSKLPDGESWSLEIDPNDAQALLFRYPRAVAPTAGEVYVQPNVKKHMGEMFFHEPRPFGEVIATIEAFERTFNARS